MSNRPGIGRRWIERYWSDFYPKNFMWYKGRKIRPPKYYDRVFGEIDAETLERVKRGRRKRARELMKVDPIRLLCAEEIKLQQIEKLERIYDAGISV